MATIKYKMEYYQDVYFNHDFLDIRYKESWFSSREIKINRLFVVRNYKAFMGYTPNITKKEDYEHMLEKIKRNADHINCTTEYDHNYSYDDHIDFLLMISKEQSLIENIVRKVYLSRLKVKTKDEIRREKISNIRKVCKSGWKTLEIK